VLEALESARAILIGPSNPIISIGPILALPAVRDALQGSVAPVVAVSPVVQGKVLKPATVPLMEWAGYPLNAAGVAAFYDGVIDGLLSDQPADAVPVLQTDVLMADAEGRRRVAEQALTFALSLR
jgi:LPPG:FO 2-phospho-L-lactate transferase